MSTPTLLLGERVVAVLGGRPLRCAMIGALAMTAHGYARATHDLDLAVCVRLDELRLAAADLRAAGLGVDLREPDPQDPLGGVIDVDGGPGADLVPVVNYYNSTRADSDAGRVLGEAALASARPLVPGLALPVVDLPHLVALKLYAWDGRTPTAKAFRDACALLAANPHQSLDDLRAVCQRVHLGPEVEALLRLRPRP